MAITLGDAVVWLRSDDSKLESGLRGAESKTKSWVGGLGGMLQTGMGFAIGGAINAGINAIGSSIMGLGATVFGVSTDMQAATSGIQAQLGLTAEEAENLGQVALNVFGNNFAGSVGEASQAVALVRQQLGDLADEELQRVTENAFRLNDVFGVETPESISAAKTLMENFGLTSDEAFDFIAGGFQKGLDRSGDFLDTIGEYSTQFANGGADAGQFFSLLESGLQGGMLGTDKAADTFKEFRVRIQDGSKTTRGALEAIGISADELAAGMANGTVTAADAFGLVLDKLRSVDDENIRMQAGVGLLGTQFEDLGTDAALSLSLIGQSMEDLEGAAGSLDAKYNNLGDVFEGFKRKVLVAIAPIGDALLDIANNAMPLVNSAFDFFEANVVPALETAAGVIRSFVGNLTEGMSPLDAFVEAIWDIAPQWLLDALVNLRDNIEGFMGIAQRVVNEVIPALVAFAGPIIEQVVPGLQLLGQIMMNVAGMVLPLLIQWWNFLIDNINLVLPVLGVVGAAIMAMTSPIALVIGAIVLLATAWANNWGGIQGKTQAVMDYLQPYWDKLTTLLGNFANALLPRLQEVWQTLVNSWQTELQPALAELWAAFGELFEALGIGGGEIDWLNGIIGILEVALRGVLVMVELLSPMIELWSGGVSYAVSQVTLMVNGIASLKRGLDAVIAPLQRVADKIRDMINEALSMPDWLIPGSPTPFEMGLRGIGKAINQMPDLTGGMGGIQSALNNALALPDMSNLSLPPFGGQNAAGGDGSSSTANSQMSARNDNKQFHLHVSSSQPVDSIIQEYAFLKAMGV